MDFNLTARFQITLELLYQPARVGGYKNASGAGWNNDGKRACVAKKFYARSLAR